MTVKTLAKDVLAGDRRALGKAITLLESSRAAQRDDAEALLALLAPKAGDSLRIGVTGAPGVGKSTLIEVLGKVVLAKKHRLAVLAVDPSSPVTGGSILGDRVRMEDLSRHDDVFIRPSPAGVTLGGVARRTREAILACEAAGYDVVLIETVGVGQSETVVASMVDFFVVLQHPNAGDEIQGMKKGVLELADLVAVTKADGDLVKDAKLAKRQLEQALSLTAGHDERATVHLVSSTEGTGIAELWKTITTRLAGLKKDGTFAARRRDQATAWFHSELGDRLRERLTARADLAKALKAAERDVRAGKEAASVAAGRVLDLALG